MSRYFVTIILMSYLNRNSAISASLLCTDFMSIGFVVHSRMTSGEDKSREVDTAVEDLRRYKAHLSEIARYELINTLVFY